MHPTEWKDLFFEMVTLSILRGLPAVGFNCPNKQGRVT